MAEEPKRNWLYEERQAFIVLRKAIQRKPWIVEELIKGLSEEMAPQHSQAGERRIEPPA